MSLKDKKEVIKHSSAIQISNNINLLQRKAWNVLLANAFNDLDKKEIFKINIQELCSILKYKSRNDKHLKELLIKLLDIKIQWNILGKDKTKELGAMVFLSEVKIINGVLFYAYPPTLRNNLYNPNIYAKINLKLQNKFKSKHSLALYELFVDYFNIKKNYGETPIITFEDFRKLLGLKEKEYSKFKDINQHIIKKAIKEINELSDLYIKTEYYKESRKIVGFKFYISKNSKNLKEEKKRKKEQEKKEKELITKLQQEFEDRYFDKADKLLNEFSEDKKEMEKYIKT